MSSRGRAAAVLAQLVEQRLEAEALGVPRDTREDVGYNGGRRLERALVRCGQAAQQLRVVNRWTRRVPR